MRFTPATYSAVGLFALLSACAVLFALHDFTLNELQRKFVLGRDGVEMRLGSGETLSFKPWRPQEMNRTLLSMLALLCAEGGLPEDCYTNANARFRTFRELHVVETSGRAQVLERNAEALAIEDLTPGFVRERIRMISEWALANQRENGSLPYMYAPSTDTYPDSDNAIRQLITVQGLYAIARAEENSELRLATQRLQENIFADLYRRGPGGSAYIADYDGQTPLGATALAVLALREDAGNAPPSQTEQAFAEYLLRAQREDGSFQTFLESATSTRDEQFYSGEALMALAMLDLVSDDARLSAAIEKSYQYYEQKLKQDFMPQYTPWHMQAYALAYQKSRDERYAEYVYWLADGLIETMLKHDPRARPDEVGRFYNPEYPAWGPPHSASTSIYVEGLTYAYELAKMRGDARKAQKYKDAILAGTRSLLLVQWTPASAYYLDDPKKVIGSFKVAITDNRSRIDQTGHTANALVRVLATLRD